MSEFSFEGLFDEQEKSDYVVQCNHPVFASYAISTYTSGQFYRFLQRHPGVLCHVVASATSGVCTAYDEINQKNYENKADCEDAAGEWFGGSEAKFNLDETYKKIFSAETMSTVQIPMFARYDTLKKQYIEVARAGWFDRYPQAMNLISKHVNQGSGGQRYGDLISGLIFLNKEANRGEYRFLATDSDAIKKTKLNVQLLLNEIQSSLSGVVTYKQNLGFKLHPECDTFESGVHFQLHLYDDSVETRSNKRAVVQRGNPRFAMQPNLAFGSQYAGAIPTNGRPGVYPTSQPGGDNNPQNMVGGELKLSYNPNTKEFEAGNKNILARLLTDIAGVGLNNVNMSNVDAITGADMEPEGAHYFGNYAKGWAMPLQMHNNNPYEYGPVLKNEDCDKDKKHKIRVINRSSKKFPAGQIVMCTKIDGEWIIMDFGESNINTKSFEFGRWQFWKLLANKDSYRRDDRFHYDPNLAAYHTNVVRDNIYEGYFRAKFYQDINDHVNDTVFEDFCAGGRYCIDDANRAGGRHEKSLGVMNGGYDEKILTPADTSHTPPIPATYHWVRRQFNFIGSRRYQQTTSFDQLSKTHGGNADANMLGAINPYHDETGGGIENVTADEYLHRKLYPHWGPVLRHGYVAENVTALGSTDQGNGQAQGYRAGGSNTSSISVGYLLNASNVPLKDIKTGLTYGSANWTDLSKNGFNADDGMGIHIPADVATNAAPYSANGAPIEDMNELLRCVNIVNPKISALPSPANNVSQGYTAGNAPDLMRAGGLLAAAGQDLVAGVRTYLSDRIDDLFDSSNVGGLPPNSRYDATPTAANYPVYTARGGQKSWRLGERPKQARWVYMAKDDGTSPTGAQPESLYDLTPIHPNRVVFVPITAEHFGTYDHRQGIKPPILDPSYAFNESLGDRSMDLFTSANLAWPVGGLGNDKYVWPYPFLRRNRDWHWSPLYGAGDLGGDRIRYAGGGLHGDDLMTILLNHRNSVPAMGTSFGSNTGPGSTLSGGGGNSNGDLYESTDSDLRNGGTGKGIPYGIYTRHAHKYGEGGQGYAPNDIWTGMGQDGVAAVGIASAKCTVKCRGYEIAIKTLMSAGIQRQVPRGYQRWGSSGDGQTDFGTTAGYAKVYDAWPEESTIFDPRYFAVMHFNDGQLLSAASGQFVGQPSQDDESKMDTYDDMWRWVDNEETTVDYRIPTMSGAPGSTEALEIPYAAQIFKSSFYDKQKHLKYMIRVKSEWAVSTTRRGMLLPFKWRKKTICLAQPRYGHNIHYYNKQSGKDDRTGAAPSVWIAASGEGYVAGHTFSVAGGDPDIAGSMVITKVNTHIDSGRLGAIIELTPGDHITTPTNGSLGEGYDPQFFVGHQDYNRIRNMNPNDPVSEAPQLGGIPSINPAGQANTGVGAVVYVLHGQCEIIEKLDIGPIKQQSAVRFTPASNGKGGAKRLAPYARKLSIPRPNKDFAYDLFLQHHNDASHVFMHSKNNLDGRAQFTDVEIIGV